MRDTAEAIYRRLPGLLPEGIDRRSVGRSAEHAGRSAGRAGGDCRAAADSFAAEHEQLLKVLFEPFTVALENDRRLRELMALREKVEAENRSLLTKLGRNDLSDAIVGAESGLRGVMDRVSLVVPRRYSRC